MEIKPISSINKMVGHLRVEDLSYHADIDKVFVTPYSYSDGLIDAVKGLLMYAIDDPDLASEYLSYTSSMVQIQGKALCLADDLEQNFRHTL